MKSNIIDNINAASPALKQQLEKKRSELESQISEKRVDRFQTLLCITACAIWTLPQKAFTCCDCGGNCRCDYCCGIIACLFDNKTYKSNPDESVDYCNPCNRIRQEIGLFKQAGKEIDSMKPKVMVLKKI